MSNLYLLNHLIDAGHAITWWGKGLNRAIPHMSHKNEVSAMPCPDATAGADLSGGVAETLLHETAGSGWCAMGI